MQSGSLVKEILKDISGYEGLYQVSNQGRILGVSSGKYLIPRTVQKGYQKVDLWKNGKRVFRPFVHKLVAEAFIGSRPDGKQINHKNHLPSDNRVENLEWVTCKENVHHNRVSNRKIAAQKLSQSSVRYIRLAHQVFGIMQKDLAECFGVHPSNISAICLGRSWGHLRGEER